jgi:hypothetical protein
MVRIRVEYDKYNRVFKLVDREFGSVLEDGTQYELALPLPTDIAIDNGAEPVVWIKASQLAHA